MANYASAASSTRRLRSRLSWRSLRRRSGSFEAGKTAARPPYRYGILFHSVAACGHYDAASQQWGPSLITRVTMKRVGNLRWPWKLEKVHSEQNIVWEVTRRCHLQPRS